MYAGRENPYLLNGGGGGGLLGVRERERQREGQWERRGTACRGVKGSGGNGVR